jgi:hypothetical protein
VKTSLQRLLVRILALQIIILLILAMLLVLRHRRHRSVVDIRNVIDVEGGGITVDDDTSLLLVFKNAILTTGERYIGVNIIGRASLR